MRKPKKLKALLRAIGVVASMAVLASGVTFAALQSQQNILSGNTIETATANLEISKDGINYANSQPGYDFNSLIPGGPAMPITGYPVYLKNTGQTGLALKLAITSVPLNPNNVDLSKVNVVVTPVSGGTPQSYTLQWLSSGGLVSIGNVDSGASTEYKIQITMANDAVTGSTVSLGNIDFAFSGVAVSN